MIVTDIEAELLTLVKAVTLDRVRVVASLPAFWTSDLIRRAVQNAPGVYVRWNGGQAGDSIGNLKSTWLMTAVVQTAATAAAPRVGHPTHIGAYDLVELVIRGLDNCPVADQGSLRLIGCKPVLPEVAEVLNAVAYDIEFALRHDMGDAVDLAQLDDFITVDVITDLPPLDGTTDIQASITLDQ